MFINLITKAVVVIYVDNLILITRDVLLIEELKAKLLQRYKARDLSPISFYLGICIIRNRPNRSLAITIDSYVN
jgi:hypothetical protein